MAISCEMRGKIVKISGCVSSLDVPRWFAGVMFSMVSATCASAQLMTTPGKFEVSPTGAATYSIPIAVPPGTAGIKPQLTLEYGSQNANGIVGVGWSLGGLPAITRCSHTIIQNGASDSISFGPNDLFCLDGQQLKAVTGSYGADGTEYRTEIESFSRIISHGSDGISPAYFEVRTKSGLIMTFGFTADARPLAPNNTSRSWLLDVISDTRSNYVFISYTNDHGQAYPLRIDYTGNSSVGLAPYNSVQFEYAARPDVELVYHAGATTSTMFRLSNIKTYAGTSLVADYRLAYEQSPGSLRSRVTSITTCAADGACLPATSFTWTNGGNGTFTQVGQPSAGNPTQTGPNCSVSQQVVCSLMTAFSGDFNGDGKTDYALAGSDTLDTYLSNGDGTFTKVTTSISPVGSPPSASWTPIVGDFNGDGKTDFGFIQFDIVQIYYSLGDGTFVRSVASLNVDGGNSNFGAPPHAAWTPITGDFNGDGIADFALAGSDVVYTFLANGDGNFTKVVQPISPVGWPPSAAWTPIAGDFNGDGKSDFGFVQGNVVQTYLSQGDGTFARVVSTFEGNYGSPPHASWTPIIGDFNGDGKTDYAFLQNDVVQTYLSRGDGTFDRASNSLFLTFGSPPNASWTPITGDFNGDGKTDFALIQGTVIWCYLSKGNGEYQLSGQIIGTNLGSPPDASWSPIGGDFNGDGKSDFAFAGAGSAAAFLSVGDIPDLLATFTGGLGLVTAITYAPLTQGSVYTKDTNASYPLVDMISPIYVVSRVDTSDGVGGNRSWTYSYAGAKSNVLGRFLGFRQSTMQDLQTSIVQTTSFRQDFPFIGLAQSTTRQLGAQILGQSSNTYQFSNVSGAAAVSSPSVASAPYRVSVAQNVTSGSDLDGTTMPTVTTSNQYDAFNNATQIVVSTPDGFSKTTTNTYVNDVVNWFLGRLTNSSVVSTTP